MSDVILEVMLACIVAATAGFVDAAAGGGGLIQVPGLFLLCPQAAPAMVLGTNKAAGFTGTAFAARRYLKDRGEPVSKTLWLAAGVAIATATLGAFAAKAISPGVMRIASLVCLGAVFVMLLLRRNLGKGPSRTSSSSGIGNPAITTPAMGAAAGAYDGFLGAGTGSLLLIGFDATGEAFKTALAKSKLINAASNLAALVVFAAAGSVILKLAIPMAACNALGARLGSFAALRLGATFVRRLSLFVVGIMLLRLALG
jgi:uncharacterized protein